MRRTKESEGSHARREVLPLALAGAHRSSPNPIPYDRINDFKGVGPILSMAAFATTGPGNEARLFHDADPSARQGLAAMSARGSRGLFACRRTGLRRRLCGRALDRPGREHHLLRHVHRLPRRRAPRTSNSAPARSTCRTAIRRALPPRSPCSTTCWTAASSSASARVACSRTPRCSAISMPTATRCSSKPSTRCSTSGPASRPTTQGQILDGLDRAHHDDRHRPGLPAEAACSVRIRRSS